uniref:RRM domain-containing protein n=1 Tax=Manihot esculenta TaxID=3983 RepID=A0A2C9UC18_MANES
MKELATQFRPHRLGLNLNRQLSGLEGFGVAIFGWQCSIHLQFHPLFSHLAFSFQTRNPYCLHPQILLYSQSHVPFQPINDTHLAESIALAPALQLNPINLHRLLSSLKRMTIRLKPYTLVDVGLPLSTSEGSLKKSFSQFGEVNRAKIVSDKKTKQSLGSAFVWFTNEDSAKLAVKEMDGKFFEGRFIYVTISKPGACKTSGKPTTTPYKF